MELIERIIKSYKVADQIYAAASGAFWDAFTFVLKNDIHNALLSGDVNNVASLLRDPSSNKLFWGFDAIAQSSNEYIEPHELVIKRLNKKTEWQQLYSMWILDSVLSFASMIGARRLPYPEIEIDKTINRKINPISIDTILDDIENVLKFPLNFPNPYRNELGISSKRGVISMRAIQSLYQAWKIYKLSKKSKEIKVLEIGAGLGRTAYFSHCFGIRDYTIIDIPMTNVAQSYFLGRVLGSDKISLIGDSADSKKTAVKILPSYQLTTLEDMYDIIVNVDSLTEMPIGIAKQYFDFAKAHSKIFLSINHEYNAFCFRDLYADEFKEDVDRHLYPLRRGYIEEILKF